MKRRHCFMDICAINLTSPAVAVSSSTGLLLTKASNVDKNDGSETV